MDEETRSLEELHAEAVAEGGQLTVYAGGDFAGQQDGLVDAFAADFPDVTLNMIVDYSKFHDVRIDRQLETGTLVPDIAQLQTSFDFPRWKERGVLAPYRPAGWSAIPDGFKDADGTWAAVTVYAFSLMRSAGTDAPVSPEQLADPVWRGQIVSSHPGDDDATLFLFRSYVQRYGWDWLVRFADNEVRFARGTNSPGEAVAAGDARVGVAGAWGGQPDVTWVAPPTGHPFLAWGQRAAIFRDAPHPAAARLYLNWMLSEPVQRSSFHGWSVRADLVGEGGRIWENPDAGAIAFSDFMADRADVERWRQTFNLVFGEVTGPPTPGRLGLAPTRHA